MEEEEEEEGRRRLVAISWYYLHLPWSALAVTDALYLISGHGSVYRYLYLYTFHLFVGKCAG